jgi:hypothetical protein
MSFYKHRFKAAKIIDSGGIVLIAMIDYNESFYTNLIHKYERARKKAPIHVDIFARRGVIYVSGLDDGFSAAFVYMAYLKARERGLEAKLIYARYIDGEWLPEDVKKMGEKWMYRKLDRIEIEELKKRFITDHIFDRWCGVR